MAAKGGPRPPMFDARTIFNRLDTNHDGKLSFEEFAVGVQHLHQFLAMRAPRRQMPRPGVMMRQARDKMFAYGSEFGKVLFTKGRPCPCGCPYCGAAMKGPQHRGPAAWSMANACPGCRQWFGQQYGHGPQRPGHARHGGMQSAAYGPWQHGGMGWGPREFAPWQRGEMAQAEYRPWQRERAEWMERGPGRAGGMGWGPMHFAGREFAEGFPPPPDVMFSRGPAFDGGREWDNPRPEPGPWFEGRQRGEGRQWFDGPRHPQAKKAEMKKHEGKNREMKKPAGKPEKKVGAERSDFAARLAALERQQAQILSVLQMLASEHQSNKELARGGEDFRRERRHHDEDED
jgi:hypothetical protein